MSETDDKHLQISNYHDKSQSETPAIIKIRHLPGMLSRHSTLGYIISAEFETTI